MDEVPELRVLSNELVPVKEKWEELGKLLGITEEQLQQCTHPEWFTDPVQLLCCVLDFWLRGNTSVSPAWENVIHALESVKEIELSEKLKKKYCPGRTPLGVHSSQTPASHHTVSAAAIVDHEDFGTICEYLSGLENPQIIRLGIVLGLDVFKLQHMPTLPDDMVRAWLLKEDSVLENCSNPLTWSDLVKALRRVGQNGLAEQILKDKSPDWTPLMYSTGIHVTQTSASHHTVSAAAINHRDIVTICGYLSKLEDHQIIRLGIVLGLDVFKLQHMQTLPDDMVRAWLRKEDSVLENCSNPLTWSDLVKALQRIGQNGIAEQIFKDESLDWTPLMYGTGVHGSQTSTSHHTVSVTAIDHIDICRYLYKLEDHQIVDLGIVLGLDAFKLQYMRTLPDDMVRAWLRKDDSVLENCSNPLTWSDLVKALRRIGQNGIAEQIHEDKCTPGASC